MADQIAHVDSRHPIPGEWRCSICKPSALRNLSDPGLCGHTRDASNAVANERQRIVAELRRRNKMATRILAREIEEGLL